MSHVAPNQPDHTAQLASSLGLTMGIVDWLTAHDAVKAIVVGGCGALGAALVNATLKALKALFEKKVAKKLEL